MCPLVGQAVVQGEAGGPGLGHQFGVDAEVGLLEGLFVQHAPEADAVRRLFVDGQHHLAGRQVAGPAMQGQQLPPVHARMADPLEAGARHQFVEAFQPAQAVAAFQVDEGRIDHLAYRGIPAQSQGAGLGAQDVHAAGRHHGELHSAGIDLDQHRALQAPATQAVHADGKGQAVAQTQAIAADAPVLHRLVGSDEGVFPGRGAGTGKEQETARQQTSSDHGVPLAARSP